MIPGAGFVQRWNLLFWKIIVIFEINTHKYVDNEFLAKTVIFGIGFAFSEGPESAFSQGVGPGHIPLGPFAYIYKLTVYAEKTHLGEWDGNCSLS